jgi:hypothetical protein
MLSLSMTTIVDDNAYDRRGDKSGDCPGAPGASASKKEQAEARFIIHMVVVAAPLQQQLAQHAQLWQQLHTCAQQRHW